MQGKLLIISTWYQVPGSSEVLVPGTVFRYVDIVRLTIEQNMPGSCLWLREECERSRGKCQCKQPPNGCKRLMAVCLFGDTPIARMYTPSSNTRTTVPVFSLLPGTVLVVLLYSVQSSLYDRYQVLLMHTRT